MSDTAAERARPSVSVCMASYNGAAHLPEQLDSILPQLPPDGELVIVDDASTDGTPLLLAERAGADPRIRVLHQEANRGYVATFQRALREARGELLLLSDQDDVWTPEHVPTLVTALAGADAVASGLELLDGRPLPSPLTGRPWRLSHRPRRVDLLRILAGAAPYFGCAMGIRRRALRTLLPFPAFLTESHDLWIAICGLTSGRMAHSSVVTVVRRLHAGNASPSRPRGASAVARSRVMLLRAMLVALHRHRRAARS